MKEETEASSGEQVALLALLSCFYTFTIDIRAIPLRDKPPLGLILTPD
eukprot:gene11074-7705_t